MKRLEVTTDTQVMVEYHLNEDAAKARVATLARKHPTAKFAIKPVVKHIEVKVPVALTLNKYTEIK